MATCSLSSSTILHVCSSSSSSRTKTPSLALSLTSLNNILSLKSARPLRIYAAPELLEGSLDVSDGGPEEVSGAEVPSRIVLNAEAEKVSGAEVPSRIVLDAEAEKMAPKQKIRIKLRSYWTPLIEDSCKQIMDVARTTNAKTMGPVPLPTKKRIYCTLKSPHVHKDARFHFEIRTHQRLIDILYPTAQTIDSLMQLDLPAGVDVEVKL